MDKAKAEMNALHSVRPKFDRMNQGLSGERSTVIQCITHRHSGISYPTVLIVLAKSEQRWMARK